MIKDRAKRRGIIGVKNVMKKQDEEKGKNKETGVLKCKRKKKHEHRE